MRRNGLATWSIGVICVAAAAGACSGGDDSSSSTNAANTGTPTSATNGTSSTTGAATTGVTSSTANGTTSSTVTSTSTSTSSSTTATTSTTDASTTTGSTVTSTATTGSDTSSTSAGGATSTTSTSTTGGDCAEGLAGAIERGSEYVLEFGGVYFAAQAAGGKVIEFRRAEGANLFTDSSVNETNFGTTMWTAPQADWDWPPPTAVDSDPYTVTVDDAAGTITMVSNGTPDVGPNVKVTKLFAADLCADAIDITYTVENAGTDAISIAPWEISRVGPGGLAFFGAEEQLLTGANVGLMPTYETDTYWFDHAEDHSGDPGPKLFAEATEGYLAFTNGTDLFVKSWTDVPPTSHPAEHGEVEIYDGEAGEGLPYVELETLGSLTSLAAGATATFEIRWRVRPMPEGATAVVGDAMLKAAAKALAAQ